MKATYLFLALALILAFVHALPVEDEIDREDEDELERKDVALDDINADSTLTELIAPDETEDLIEADPARGSKRRRYRYRGRYIRRRRNGPGRRRRRRRY